VELLAPHHATDSANDHSAAHDIKSPAVSRCAEARSVGSEAVDECAKARARRFDATTVLTSFVGV
jgi:hypothetical protein